MSEPRKNRRQFLADALFAGGSLAAAAVATRWFMQKDPEPAVAGAVIPDDQPTPTPHYDGQVAKPPPAFEPHIGGAVAPPGQ